MKEEGKKRRRREKRRKEKRMGRKEKRLLSSFFSLCNTNLYSFSFFIIFPVCTSSRRETKASIVITMSTGVQNPMRGSRSSPVPASLRDPKSPGGAIRGFMAPPSSSSLNKDYPDFEHVRFTLKNAWNTTYPHQLRQAGIQKPMQTPFRVAMNSGDLLMRQNYACGQGACQSSQSRPNLKGLSQHFGSSQGNCRPSVMYSIMQDNPTVPSATCNGKLIAAASEYTRFKKHTAQLKNMNALSYGGNDFHGSQSVLKAIRRH